MSRLTELKAKKGLLQQVKKKGAEQLAGELEAARHDNQVLFDAVAAAFVVGSLRDNSFQRPLIDVIDKTCGEIAAQ